ncbi:hypothetical protein ACLOJK_039909 [Asimina triloba]
MILLEHSIHELLPSFLYISLKIPSIHKLLNPNHNPAFFPSQSPSPSPSPSEDAALPSKSFVVPAPKEPRKIELYLPAFYAPCAAGGIFSCGLTHTPVTPLDLVKCNMQITWWWILVFLLRGGAQSCSGIAIIGFIIREID